MKNIEITVMKKVAYADGMPTIVCGNNDYTLSFVFDDEWSDELHKVARFSFVKNGLKGFIDVPIENDTCKVPVLLGIGLVRVGVYAGDLRTTTGAKIKCTKSILCDDAEEMVEPFENLYEEIKGNIADLEKGTIKTINSPKIWELGAGVYRVSGAVAYGKFESPAQPNCIKLIDKVGILMVGLSPMLQNRRDFYLFVDGKIYFGYSVDLGLEVDGDISGVFSKITKEISTTSTPDEIPSAKAVVDYVDESIKNIENGFDYTLQVGGDELGGVKNGGNVVINEDGTMTAPEILGGSSSIGGLNSTAINLLIQILQEGIYSTNVSGKIEQLQTALAQGGSGGSGGGSEDNDAPTTTDDITVTDGIMTIVSVGSKITVSNDTMMID